MFECKYIEKCVKGWAYPTHTLCQECIKAKRPIWYKMKDDDNGK